MIEEIKAPPQIGDAEKKLSEPTAQPQQSITYRQGNTKRIAVLHPTKGWRDRNMDVVGCSPNGGLDGRYRCNSPRRSILNARSRTNTYIHVPYSRAAGKKPRPEIKMVPIRARSEA